LQGLKPTELVRLQVNAMGQERDVILLALQDFINSVPNLRYKSQKKYYSDCRSFFNHNRAELPLDRSFKFRSDVAPVTGKLSVENYRRLLHNCNGQYRVVFSMMGQGFMGSGELVYVNRHHASLVWDGVLKNVGFLKLELPGRKQNLNVKPYFTVLNTNDDWANEFRAFAKTVPKPRSDVMFLNTHGKALTRQNIENYLYCRGLETGLIVAETPNCKRCGGKTVKRRVWLKQSGRPTRRTKYVCLQCGYETFWLGSYDSYFTNCRYGLNPHEIRDLMRSRVPRSGADEDVFEFMMGHLEAIDPNKYNKFWEYDESYIFQEYQKARPWLNLLSGDPSKVDRGLIDVELEKQRVKEEALSQQIVDLKQKVKRIEEAMDRKWERVLGEE